MTYPVLNAAAEVLFLVAGRTKPGRSARCCGGSAPVEEFPARGIKPASGRLTFLVDRAAAAGLGEPT